VRGNRSKLAPSYKAYARAAPATLIPTMSLAAYDLLTSVTNIVLLLTLFIGVFVAAASLRRVGRPAVLALLAFVLTIVGILATGAAVAFVRSDAIDPSPKFLALGAGNAAHALSQVIAYALLYVALFGRPVPGPASQGMQSGPAA
jgi:hypothetical protein